MAEFISYDPNVEVVGNTLYAWVAGTDGAIMDTFKAHGIDEVNLDDWYPLQTALDVMKAYSGMADLVSIGSLIIKHASFPPEIDTIENALQLLDTAYHMNHRGGEIGHYHYEKVGERAVDMTVNGPYPTNFDYGLLYTLCRQYAPPNNDLTIVIDESNPMRREGGDFDIYHITW